MYSLRRYLSTVAEIEAAIEKLPPDEFAKLAAWISALQARELDDENLGDAMDKVFRHHAPLLEKLSQ